MMVCGSPHHRVSVVLIFCLAREIDASTTAVEMCALQTQAIQENQALVDAQTFLVSNFHEEAEREKRCNTTTNGQTCEDDYSRFPGYHEFLDLCQAEGYRPVVYDFAVSCVHFLFGPYHYRIINDYGCVGTECDAEAMLRSKDQDEIDLVCESDVVIESDFSKLYDKSNQYNSDSHNNGSAPTSESIRDIESSTDSTTDYIRSALHHANSNDYPLHDAIIAAFLPALGENPDRSVSLEEIEDTLRGCSSSADDNNQDLVSQFRAVIPSIIDKATRRFNFDTGRVLETSNQKFEVGDNYYMEIKSASLSCFVSTTDLSEDINPVAAFASYVVAPLESDTESPNPIAHAHNLSMFIEADVMEMPSNLLHYIPKRYCLQGLDVDHGNKNDKYGMSAVLGNVQVYQSPEGEIIGYAPYDRVENSDVIPNDAPFLDTVPNVFNAERHERSIELGTRQGVLESRLNRLGRSIAWAHKTADYKRDSSDGNARLDYEWDLVLDSFRNPKLELWAARMAEIFGTNHFCASFLNFDEAITCLQEQIQLVIDDQELGVQASFGGTMTAVDSFGLLREWARNWRHHLETNNKEFSDDEMQSWIAQGIATEGSANEITRLMRRARYPVPYVFDRNIALWHKNSPFYPIEVNPYSEGSKVQYPDYEEESSLSQCMALSSENNSTAATIAASRIFKSALLRRFEERQGQLLSDINDWKYHDVGPSTQKKSDEVVEFDSIVSFDDNGNLQPGNLTERVLGRTAKWLMVTPWYETDRLQDLIHEVQTSKLVYSKVATEVYDGDNRCKDAASNTDIFVFVIAIALAGFGGVNGILRSVDSCCNWWAICCRGNGPSASTSPGSIRRRRIVYEWFMILLALLLFVGLFVPLGLQIAKEFQIANYHKESLSMQIDYGEWNANQNVMNSIGQPAVITFVQAESYCKDARPWALFSLFVVGFLVSICANAPTIAPYIVRGKKALRRLSAVPSSQHKTTTTIRSNMNNGSSVHNGSVQHNIIKRGTDDSSVHNGSVQHNIVKRGTNDLPGIMDVREDTEEDEDSRMTSIEVHLENEVHF